jgi:hypothetical protein
MAAYGEANYNRPYHVGGDNCADLSAGIAEKAGLNPSRGKIPGTTITRPNTLANEVKQHGVDARNQIHSDPQRERERKATDRAMVAPW